MTETCSRKNKITLPYSSYSYMQQCEKPEFKDGLCSYHYHKSQEKQKPWGERLSYVQVSEFAMNAGACMKLKSERGNVNYKLCNGIIQRWNKKENRWNETDIPADVNLFCHKTY